MRTRRRRLPSCTRSASTTKTSAYPFRTRSITDCWTEAHRRWCAGSHRGLGRSADRRAGRRGALYARGNRRLPLAAAPLPLDSCAGSNEQRDEVDAGVAGAEQQLHLARHDIVLPRADAAQGAEQLRVGRPGDEQRAERERGENQDERDAPGGVAPLVSLAEPSGEQLLMWSAAPTAAGARHTSPLRPP